AQASACRKVVPWLDLQAAEIGTAADATMARSHAFMAPPHNPHDRRRPHRNLAAGTGCDGPAEGCPTNPRGKSPAGPILAAPSADPTREARHSTPGLTEGVACATVDSPWLLLSPSGSPAPRRRESSSTANPRPTRPNRFRVWSCNSRP